MKPVVVNICNTYRQHLAPSVVELTLCGRGWDEVASLEFIGDNWPSLCKQCLRLWQWEVTREYEQEADGGEYVLSI